MIVEVLFEEFIIYGEKGNIEYLEKMFDKAKFIRTDFSQKPYFYDNRPDMIIMGPMAEINLEKVVDKLEDKKDRLKELIEDGVYLFAFNNVLDILSDDLSEVGRGKIASLGIFPYKAVRNLDDRYAELAVADYKGIEVLGMSMGFSQYYGNEDYYIYEMKTGYGFNKDSKLGGFRYKNAFLIENLGNIFMYNPDISKRLLKSFNLSEVLPFEKEVYMSYDERKKAWKKQNVF